MDLGDVFDAAGSVIEAAGDDYVDTATGQSMEKHAFSVEEPEVNEFGRVTEWYHCGIRNTGSVCKCCGEYRRDRTTLDDPDTNRTTWTCEECGAVNEGKLGEYGGICQRCRQPRLVEKSEPNLFLRIFNWFAQRPVLTMGIFVLISVVICILIFET